MISLSVRTGRFTCTSDISNPGSKTGSPSGNVGCVNIYTINLATGEATPLPGSSTCNPGNGLGFTLGDDLYLADAESL